MKSNRKLDIEMMRSFAAFFVVFNHTDTGGFLLFTQYDANCIQFWIYLMIAVFTKFAIYLFLMITGALMLNREPEPLKKLWRNRVLRMTLVLLSWLFIYYCVDVMKGRETFSIWQFLKESYGSGLSKWNHALWYLYAYIPLLITLPLLQRIAKSMSDKDYLYMICLYFAFSSLLPAMEQLLWENKYHLTSYFDLSWLCARVLFFPLLGYFLQHRAKKFWNGKRLTLLWGGNIAAIMLTCYLAYLKIISLDSAAADAEQVFSIFVAVNAATIFVTFQYLADHAKISGMVQKAICSLGGCSFGVYVLHNMFIIKTTMFGKFLHGFRDWLHMNDMVSGLLSTGCVFMMCYVVTLLLKRIPLIKKLF